MNDTANSQQPPTVFKAPAIVLQVSIFLGHGMGVHQHPPFLLDSSVAPHRCLESWRSWTRLAVRSRKFPSCHRHSRTFQVPSPPTWKLDEIPWHPMDFSIFWDAGAYPDGLSFLEWFAKWRSNHLLGLHGTWLWKLWQLWIRFSWTMADYKLGLGLLEAPSPKDVKSIGIPRCNWWNSATLPVKYRISCGYKLVDII